MTEPGIGEWRAGWRPLVGCWVGMAVGIHSLALYTQSLFFPALERGMGWDRLALSVGPTILVVGLGVASPFVGALLDRGRLRLLACGSAALLAMGFWTLSRMPNDIRWLYAIIAGMAVGGAACSTLSFSRVINSHFNRSRGTALGVAMTGTGFAAALSPVALGWVISDYGWRAGYVMLAAVTASALPLLWILLPRNDAGIQGGVTAPAAGPSFGEFLRDPTGWALAAAFMAVPIAVSGLLAHLVPLLTDRGLSLQAAASYLGIIGGTVVIARFATGILLDRFFGPHVAGLVFSASAIGLIALARGGDGAALMGAVAIGLSVGAEIDLIGYLTARYFGLRAYGRIYGFLYAACLVGSAISPLFYGWVYASTGTYGGSLIVGAAILALTAIVFFRLRPFAF